MKKMIIIFYFLLAPVLVLATVNINTATLRQLQTLTGIGEAKAKAIIEYRRKYGTFENVEEIQKVPGIGKKIYLQIRNQLSIIAPTDLPKKNKKIFNKKAKKS